MRAALTALERLPSQRLCAWFVVGIGIFTYVLVLLSDGPSGCAQGYQPIVQGGDIDESVSSLLQTRASANGRAGRQLTDDAFRRMGVYVYDHNCSWAARQSPWVEIEGGCTITKVEHCWHTTNTVTPRVPRNLEETWNMGEGQGTRDDCYDTYNYTLTRGQPSYFRAGVSFTNEEKIHRTRGASCARGKGCAAEGWEDGPPFGTRKLGEVSRCWEPSPGEEEWLPQSMCGGDVDACFKLVDPYEEMQQRYGCSSINPQTCAAKNGMDTPISDAIFTLIALLLFLFFAFLFFKTSTSEASFNLLILFIFFFACVRLFWLELLGERTSRVL